MVLGISSANSADRSKCSASWVSNILTPSAVCAVILFFVNTATAVNTLMKVELTSRGDTRLRAKPKTNSTFPSLYVWYLLPHLALFSIGIRIRPSLESLIDSKCLNVECMGVVESPSDPIEIRSHIGAWSVEGSTRISTTCNEAPGAIGHRLVRTTGLIPERTNEAEPYCCTGRMYHTRSTHGLS